MAGKGLRSATTIGVMICGAWWVSCKKSTGVGSMGATPSSAAAVASAQPVFSGVPACLLGDYEKFTPPKCWALEEGKNDGFVEYSSQLIPKPSGHSDSPNAITNTLGCVAQGELQPVLIGHGWPGGICTGNGATCINSQCQQLSFQSGNLDCWAGAPGYCGRTPWIPGEIAKSPTLLTLLSCSTGAEDEGALLLCNLAKHLGTDVRARTYRVWANGKDMLLDRAGVWQLAPAGCKTPPTKIAEPVIPLDPKAPPVIFVDGVPSGGSSGGFSVTSLSNVPEIALPSVPVPPEWGDRLAGNGNLSKACSSGASPASAELLRMVIKSKDGTITKKVAFLSGRLLKDLDNAGLYYQVGPDFSDTVRNFVANYKETHHLPP